MAKASSIGRGPGPYSVGEAYVAGAGAVFEGSSTGVGSQSVNPAHPASHIFRRILASAEGFADAAQERGIPVNRIVVEQDAERPAKFIGFTIGRRAVIQEVEFAGWQVLPRMDGKGDNTGLDGEPLRVIRPVKYSTQRYPRWRVDYQDRSFKPSERSELDPNTSYVQFIRNFVITPEGKVVLVTNLCPKRGLGSPGDLGRIIARPITVESAFGHAEDYHRSIGERAEERWLSALGPTSEWYSTRDVLVDSSGVSFDYSGPVVKSEKRFGP